MWKATKGETAYLAAIEPRLGLSRRQLQYRDSEILRVRPLGTRPLICGDPSRQRHRPVPCVAADSQRPASLREASCV